MDLEYQELLFSICDEDQLDQDPTLKVQHKMNPKLDWSRVYNENVKDFHDFEQFLIGKIGV